MENKHLLKKEFLPFGISFEFFPPKNSEGATHLLETAALLNEYEPEFFSVTFGAGGSARDGTLETVKLLQQNFSTPIAPHLSCINSSRDEILQILSLYQSLNIRRIVALRGDFSQGLAKVGEFRFASELVALIREATGNHFYIEVAAYPEIHPQAKNALDDILNLKRKYEAGADSAITQYFFNPDAYFYYLDDCTRYGIHMPIIPGIMPITQFTRLARFSDACGAEIPFWIRKRLENYGDDIDSIKQFGIEVVYNLCQKLIAGGAQGLHFYALNKAETSLQILKLMNLNKSTLKTEDQNHFRKPVAVG